MDEFLYRPMQELDKKGPIYSTKGEKQRIIAENILNLKLKPVPKYIINQNIEGLDKKKIPGSPNPAIFRRYAPLSSMGRTGIIYITNYANISRFIVPGFVFLFWYYNCEGHIRGTYYDKEWNNMERESTYLKLQTFEVHFPEKHTMMA